MIKYGNTTLNVIADSISINTFKAQIVRHYPFTDQAAAHDLGQQPTTITFTIVTKTLEEKARALMLLNRQIRRRLIIDDLYYEDVVPGPDAAQSIYGHSDKSVSYIQATLIALDPIPYYVDTGGAVY